MRAKLYSDPAEPESEGEPADVKPVAETEQEHVVGGSISDAVAAVAAAEQRFADAKIAEAEARDHAAASLEKLNELQQVLDEQLLSIRGAAPKESDWGRRQSSLNGSLRRARG